LELAQPDRFGADDAILFYASGPSNQQVTYINDRGQYFPNTQRCLLVFDGKRFSPRRYAVTKMATPAQADAAYPRRDVGGHLHLEENPIFEFIYRDDVANASEHTDYIFWKKLTYPETNVTASSVTLPIVLTAEEIRHPLQLTAQLVGSVRLGAQSNFNTHRVRLDWNGKPQREHAWANIPMQRLTMQLNPHDCHAGTNTLTIDLLEPGDPKNANSSATKMKIDVAYLDWVNLDFTQPSNTRPGGNELRLDDAQGSRSEQRFSIGGFATSHTLVLDLAGERLLEAPAWSDATSSGTFAMNVATTFSTTTLVTATPQDCRKPFDTTSTLLTQHFTTPSDCDLLILTNRRFAKTLESFVAWKRSRGLNPRMVCVDELYCERSGGYALSEVLRDYIKHVYTSATPAKLKYVLLVGDALPVSKFPTGLPTYSYAESGHPANENYFANFENQMGEPKVAVGRFSVDTEEQLSNLIEKIRRYEARQSDGLWRARYLMIAASEEWARNDSRQIIDQFIKPNYMTQYLWSDPKNSNPAYHEQLNTGLVKYFNAGNLITVFFGHGGGTIWEIGPTLFQGLMTKHLFDQKNVETLTNSGAPPLVFALTCYTNDFDNPDVPKTLGETFVNSRGGAIGVIGAAVRTSTYYNFQFIQKFLDLLKQRKATRLGDLFLLTKQALRSETMNKTYLLLGDPTLEFSLPTPAIKLTEFERAASGVTCNYELPTSATLPVHIQCALLDAHDNELLNWQYITSSARGQLRRSVDGVTSATTGTLRLVAYCSNGASADFVGSITLGTPPPPAVPPPAPINNVTTTTTATAAKARAIATTATLTATTATPGTARHAAKKPEKH
jgi:hypothetical protein